MTTHHQPKNSFIIFILMITIIIDSMGLGLVFPVIPGLMMEHNSVFFGPSIADSTRHFWYGVSMAMWPLGIFAGSALLGRLSDIYGRKRLIIVALLGMTASYLLSVISFHSGLLSVFVFSRFLSGFFGGSFGIAQAVILDISPTDKKARNLGFITLSASIGFVIGPVITTLIGWLMQGALQSLEMPFYIGGILALLNMVSVALFLNETYRRKSKATLKLLEVMLSFRMMFMDKRIRLLALSFLALQVGWGFYTQGLPLILAQKFHFSQTAIGAYFIVLSMGFMLTTLFFQNSILKIARPKTVIIISSTILGLMLALCTYAMTITSQFILSFFGAGLQILCYTSLLAWLSERINEDEQGAVMGGTVSVFGIAWTINAFLIGMMVNYSLLLPFYIAAIAILFSGSLLMSRRT